MIVPLPDVGCSQHLGYEAESLESLLGIGHTSVLVRVELKGAPSVGLGDLIRGGASLDVEEGVESRVGTFG